MKPLLHKDIRLSSNFTYRSFLKRGYRVIPTLRVGFDARDHFSKKDKIMKVLKVLKKTKMVKRLDLAKFAIPSSQAVLLAKKMVSVSCLKMDDGKRFADLWSKYMKNLKSYSKSLAGHQGQRFYYSYQQIGRLAKEGRCLNEEFKYLPRLEKITAEIDFPSGPVRRIRELDDPWRFEDYPESIRRICFNETRYLEKPLKISMSHLKNLKDFTFNFGSWYQNSTETTQLAVDLLVQVPQLEVIQFDFLEHFVITPSMCFTLKSLTKVKKARFSFSLEKDEHNLQILECIEDWPLEELHLRLWIGNECFLSGVSSFLWKKKDLKALKLWITNKWVFQDPKIIEDLLHVVDSFPQLTSFSFFIKAYIRERILGDPYYSENFSEIDLSFEKLFSRSIPLKKFKISLPQYNFSERAFMKLLASLQKFSKTLEKIRIDAGEIKPKTCDKDKILDFLRSLHNIRSLKFYSLDVTKKEFLWELSRAIQRLKFLRVFCIGEVSAKLTKTSFTESLKKICVKPGLERFDCEISQRFENILCNDSSQALDLYEIQQKNQYLQSWPQYSLYSNKPQ